MHSSVRAGERLEAELNWVRAPLVVPCFAGDPFVFDSWWRRGAVYAVLQEAVECRLRLRAERTAEFTLAAVFTRRRPSGIFVRREISRTLREPADTALSETERASSPPLFLRHESLPPP